jgi:hypothetical protein
LLFELLFSRFDFHTSSSLFVIIDELYGSSYECEVSFNQLATCLSCILSSLFNSSALFSAIAFNSLLNSFIFMSLPISLPPPNIIYQTITNPINTTNTVTTAIKSFFSSYVHSLAFISFSLFSFKHNSIHVNVGLLPILIIINNHFIIIFKFNKLFFNFKNSKAFNQ